MTMEIWVAFVTVVFVFAIIPGPTVILVVGQALAHGRKSVTPLVLGVLLGDLTAMTLSLIGLGAVLATSASLFLMLKWLGVGYLIYLGIKAWREVPQTDITLKGSGLSSFGLFRSSFLVTAFNPKGIVFFVAFLPQFVSSTSPALPQLLILMVTFLGVISITISCFAYFSGNISHKMQSYRSRVVLNKVGGGAMVGAGLLTSTIQRS